MTEAIAEMSRQPVAGYRGENLASVLEEDSRLLTLVLDILRRDMAGRGIEYTYFEQRRG